MDILTMAAVTVTYFGAHVICWRTRWLPPNQPSPMSASASPSALPLEIWYQIIDMLAYNHGTDFHSPYNVEPGYRRRAQLERDQDLLQGHYLSLVWKTWYVYLENIRGARTAKIPAWQTNVFLGDVSLVEVLSILIPGSIPLQTRPQTYHRLTTLRVDLAQIFDDPRASWGLSPVHPEIEHLLELLPLLPLRSLSMPIDSGQHMKVIRTSCPLLVTLAVFIPPSRFLSRIDVIRSTFTMARLEILHISSASAWDMSTWNLPALRHLYYDHWPNKLAKDSMTTSLLASSLGQSLETIQIMPLTTQSKMYSPIEDLKEFVAGESSE